MSLLKHKMFDRTHICFNDAMVWLSMNPPAAYLVKYISHNSCLPELLITEVWYIPSNYGPVYKKIPKLSKVRRHNRCMCSQCGKAQTLVFLGAFEPATASSICVELLVEAQNIGC